MSYEKLYDHRDKGANKNATLATILTAVFVVLALFLITFSVDAKKTNEEEGILVNFGTMQTGQGNVQPESASEQKPSTIKKETAHSTQTKPSSKPSTTQPATNKKENLVTQKQETKVVEKTQENNDVKPQNTSKQSNNKEAKQNELQDTEQHTNTDAPETERPKVNTRAIYTGKKQVDSKGEGNDGSPGDKGQPDGSSQKGAYEGTNSGLGKSGVGYALTGRRLVTAPRVNDHSNIEGKITVNIKVDQNGSVITASLGKPTTISENSLIQKTLAAAKRAKFDSNRKASEEQFGTMTFVYRVK